MYPYGIDTVSLAVVVGGVSLKIESDLVVVVVFRFQYSIVLLLGRCIPLFEGKAGLNRIFGELFQSGAESFQIVRAFEAGAIRAGCNVNSRLWLVKVEVHCIYDAATIKAMGAGSVVSAFFSVGQCCDLLSEKGQAPRLQSLSRCGGRLLSLVLDLLAELHRSHKASAESGAGLCYGFGADQLAQLGFVDGGQVELFAEFSKRVLRGLVMLGVPCGVTVNELVKEDVNHAFHVESPFSRL